VVPKAPLPRSAASIAFTAAMCSSMVVAGVEAHGLGRRARPAVGHDVDVVVDPEQVDAADQDRDPDHPPERRQSKAPELDSPNDQPMLAFFPASIGVADLRRFLPTLASRPRFLTDAEGGLGFAELVDLLLAARDRG
jgi:hypothetical protein